MRMQSYKLYTDDLAKEFKDACAKLFADVEKKEIVVKGEGEFDVIATTETVDRDGEMIKSDGWETENFIKNPVMLDCHKYFEMPVGACTELTKLEDGSYRAKGVFARTQKAQEIRSLYEDGILRTVSVGFIPKERNGNIITKAELLEISFVPIPSNPDAMAIAKMNKVFGITGEEESPDETETIEARVKPIEYKQLNNPSPVPSEETAVKEGRVLSAKNRQQISECMDMLESTSNMLQELMDASEPPEKAVDYDAMLKALQSIDKINEGLIVQLKAKRIS